MPDKPSLYVVEKKEVVILVVLFVLVTVLSFTLGVRYGESVGKKVALEQAQAARELGEAGTVGGSGTLGAAGEGESKSPAKGEHADSHGEKGDDHDKPTEIKAAGSKDSHAPADHGADAHAKGESHNPTSPEGAAKSSASGSGGNEAVDKNSDEYLLNALKEAGVEPPGGKAPKGAKLPDDVKASPARPRIPGGTYVIQVGSHPTRNEAETQVRQLKTKRVNAEILPPFKDKQGEWHRVVVGSYRNKRDADKEASGLKGKGSIVSFFVWRLP